jgi:hypothetical protein
VPEWAQHGARSDGSTVTAPQPGWPARAAASSDKEDALGGCSLAGHHGGARSAESRYSAEARSSDWLAGGGIAHAPSEAARVIAAMAASGCLEMRRRRARSRRSWASASAISASTSISAGSAIDPKIAQLVHVNDLKTGHGRRRRHRR